MRCINTLSGFLTISIGWIKFKLKWLVTIYSQLLHYINYNGLEVVRFEFYHLLGGMSFEKLNNSINEYIYV